MKFMMKEGDIVHYLNILLDLEKKFKIQDTAYLVNATQEGTKMYLHWIDNGKDTQMEISYRSALFVKTDTAKSYYVRFKKLNECYITEYNDLYRKDEHLYYSKHISGKLIECGLVKGDKFVPFKQFEANGIMTEFVYGYNNETGDIDVSTKTKVYHGTYMNNPKKHYPRQTEEQTTVNNVQSAKQETGNTISSAPSSKPPIHPKKVEKKTSDEGDSSNPGSAVENTPGPEKGESQPSSQPKNMPSAQTPSQSQRPARNGENKQIEGGGKTNQGSTGETTSDTLNDQSKPSTKPEPATNTISTNFLHDPQSHTRGSTEKPNESAPKPILTTNTKQIVEGDNWVLENGDKILESTEYRASTLQFKESFKDTSRITQPINIQKLPFFKSLIFCDKVQD